MYDINDFPIFSININNVLSFNYTNTYKRIYDTSSDCNYDYIHGRILENNIILGIDEYLDDNLKDKNLEFIYFKKYFQRIYKKTGCTYKKWLEKIQKEENNIYFYGHSLGVSDKDIIEELIHSVYYL